MKYMKLLLTSAGITNKTIARELLDLAKKPFENLKIAFIPTAANVERGNKDWLIDDLVNCNNLGFNSIDIVDISALPRDIWELRLREADVLVFGGGNTFHLMYWVEKSGLKDILTELLSDKIYVGISAGSIITAHRISISDSKRLYSEEIGVHKKDKEALGFVNFFVQVHLNSPYFPKIKKEILELTAKELREPMYVIDDQTAIKVVGKKVEIVGEGEYLEFNL
jgi:dipeptidase E